MIGTRRQALAAGLIAAAGVRQARADELRVLSLGGAITEAVFALGAGGQLVGCDLTSRFPAGADALPKVGYLRALGAEGALSLRPGLVLASADAGPPAALAQIAAAQVRVVSLPEAHSPGAAIDRVLRVGAALDRTGDALLMAEAMRADLAQVGADISGSRAVPRVLFLMSAGRGAPMAAGADTAADAMIRLAGGRNAVSGFGGYRPLLAEALLLADPDVVLTTTDAIAGLGGIGGLIAAAPGLAETSAGRSGRVVAMETLYLLGFGPRLAPAMRQLAVALHPGGTLRALPERPWTA